MIDKTLKLLQYSPFLMPIIFALILFCILGKCFGATITNNSDYLSCMLQVDLVAKDIRIVLLDLRGVIGNPFDLYMQDNGIIPKNFAVAGMRLSTGKVLKFYTADTLSEIKAKAIDYAKAHNIILKFKQHLAGDKIRNWWLKTEIK